MGARMTATTPPVTIPEVDSVCVRMSNWIADTAPDDTATITLTRAEVQWLLAEVEGGREAFGTVVRNAAGLRKRIAEMQRTIDTLMSMRR